MFQFNVHMSQCRLFKEKKKKKKNLFIQEALAEANNNEILMTVKQLAKQVAHGNRAMKIGSDRSSLILKRKECHTP